MELVVRKADLLKELSLLQGIRSGASLAFGLELPVDARVQVVRIP